MKIEAIDWSQRRYLLHGGHSILYEIMLGVVAKIGGIKPSEIDIQRCLSDKAKALPVLDVAERIELPADIRRDFCMQHGVAGHPVSRCTCGPEYAARRFDVLVMPHAESADSFPAEERQRFVDEVSRVCYEKFNLFWGSDVMAYQGHLVGVDFGAN